MNPTDSIIRKILSNELTQISAICMAVWFFVVNVILPINNIESQLANIQLTLSDIKTTNLSFDQRITKNTDDILVMKAQLGNN